MFARILRVKTAGDFKLFVSFENGEKRLYDVARLCDKFEVFKDLKNIKGLFEQVKIEPKGYGSKLEF